MVQVARVDDVPLRDVLQDVLGDVLPGELGPVAEQLLGPARELETHPEAVGHIEWDWFSGPWDGLGRWAFGPTLALSDTHDDWVEAYLTLDVTPVREWTLAVHVMCCCPECPRHVSQHLVEHQEWPVTNAQTLVEGFAAGVARLRVILDGPLDPDHWRTLGGPPVRTR